MYSLYAPDERSGCAYSSKLSRGVKIAWTRSGPFALDDIGQGRNAPLSAVWRRPLDKRKRALHAGVSVFRKLPHERFSEAPHNLGVERSLGPDVHQRAEEQLDARVVQQTLLNDRFVFDPPKWTNFVGPGSAVSKHSGNLP